MQAPKQGTSSSYLIVLRKLTTQNREYHREDDRVGQYRQKARLTRSEKTTRTLGDGQQHTRAQDQEKGGRHDQVCLRQNETHCLGDEAVHEEENEGVEENSHLICLSVRDFETAPVGGQKNAWAERQKKSGWNRNFLGGNIGEHG